MPTSKSKNLGGQFSYYLLNKFMETSIKKPSRVIVEITDKCNFLCKHCFANKHDYELKVDSWVKIFNNICKKDIQSITITGGEPLLYKGLFELLSKVKIRKTILTLDTNASLINESNIKKIEKHFKKIRISFYGLNRSWHANTQSNALDEERFWQMLKLVSSSKLKVQVKIPLFANNVKNLYQILDKLREFNLYQIVLISIIPEGKAKSLSGLITESQANKLLKQYPHKTSNMRVFKWSKGKHFLIRSNGNVVLHPPINKNDYVLGNVMDRDIDELWQIVPEKYKEINAKLTTDLSEM